MVDIKELKKLAKFCRENGVLHLKDGDFEITLSAISLQPTKDKNQGADYITEDNKLSDDDILMWSSAGIPAENTDA